MQDIHVKIKEFNGNGFALIHGAASSGYVKSIEKYVGLDRDQLELETNDSLHSTPFLLAVASGIVDTVNVLTMLGAKVNAINSQNHGAVEICAMKLLINVLEFFLHLDNPKLPVWNNLFHFLSSDTDEEAEYAGKCLRILTEKIGGALNPKWEQIFQAGGIPVMVKVVMSAINDDSKIPTLHTILNIIDQYEVKEQTVTSGGIPAFVRLLKSETPFVVQLSAEILKEISFDKEFANTVAQNNAIPSLIKVIQTHKIPEVLVEAVTAMGAIAEAGSNHQTIIGSLQGAIRSIVDLYEDCLHQPLLLCLTQTINKICRHHQNNQNAFVQMEVASSIVVLTRIQRNKELQLSAVDTIHRLAENNPRTQQSILGEGVDRLLLQLLKKRKAEDLQEKTAEALWALAGDDLDEQRTMASEMGVHLLIEFINTQSEKQHFIGSEGLGVLAQGPRNQQTAIAEASGIHPLVRLLRSKKEYIVLSTVRTLRHLCVGVGYVPHADNQHKVAQSRGIKYLVALQLHSRNSLIQVESALTLATVALCNSEILGEILQSVDFSYLRLLQMMYAEEEMVRLLAGSALAAFAYNNVGQQQAISRQGGVRFHCFIPFLQSDNEFYRCCTAFQVVVLARIIPDEEQAVTAAAGIKLLVDLLQDSQSDHILALAADCIARLAHTRAGITAAIVSIGGVELLCSHLMCPAEQVRGCAAIALGYLSQCHVGERKLLNKCRIQPYFMKILLYYAERRKFSSAFKAAWRHYKRVGLPSINTGITSLVGGNHTSYEDRTNAVTDDAGHAGSIVHSSMTPLPMITEDNLTRRSSRVSVMTSNTLSPRKSQHSLDGVKSQTSYSPQDAQIFQEVTADS